MADVSALGAKLQGRALALLDPDVLISVANIHLLARVAWVHSDECGVIFEEPLSFDMIDHIKREGRSAKVMGIAA